MASIYLHNHSDFPALLRIIEGETGILAGLVEKDYWIMQVLHGLKKQNFRFELKGGTSLSKGYKIIDRFSEDIDIHIQPPAEMDINENPNNTKAATVQKRKNYYDWLAKEISIEGITSIERDRVFDDEKYYRSGGIRLYYKQTGQAIPGVKEGILLEVGFDNVAPNSPVLISSWAYDKAIATGGLELIDNRAVDIACYDPRYTFVEKLQTIATKFRQEQTTGSEQPNYMRQYYDVYCLLGDEKVQEFIGTEEYKAHKEKRFPKADFEIPMTENQAFLMDDEKLKERFMKRFEVTKALYYKGQPDFKIVLDRIRQHLGKL